MARRSHPESRIGIKSVHSPDMPTHPSAWAPDTYADVYCLLELTIGPLTEEGADIFATLVATPEGLRSHARERIVLSDRAMIVVGEYQWSAIRSRLDAIVASCDGESWSETVGKLQRYFLWEYEKTQLAPAERSLRRRGR